MSSEKVSQNFDLPEDQTDSLSIDLSPEEEDLLLTADSQEASEATTMEVDKPPPPPPHHQDSLPPLLSSKERKSAAFKARMKALKAGKAEAKKQSDLSTANGGNSNRTVPQVAPSNPSAQPKADIVVEKGKKPEMPEGDTPHGKDRESDSGNAKAPNAKGKKNRKRGGDADTGPVSKKKRPVKNLTTADIVKLSAFWRGIFRKDKLPFQEDALTTIEECLDGLLVAEMQAGSQIAPHFDGVRREGDHILVMCVNEATAKWTEGLSDAIGAALKSPITIGPPLPEMLPSPRYILELFLDVSKPVPANLLDRLAWQNPGLVTSGWKEAERESREKSIKVTMLIDETSKAFIASRNQKLFLSTGCIRAILPAAAKADSDAKKPPKKTNYTPKVAKTPKDQQKPQVQGAVSNQKNHNIPKDQKNPKVPGKGSSIQKPKAAPVQNAKVSDNAATKQSDPKVPPLGQKDTPQVVQSASSQAPQGDSIPKSLIPLPTYSEFSSSPPRSIMFTGTAATNAAAVEPANRKGSGGAKTNVWGNVRRAPISFADGENQSPSAMHVGMAAANTLRQGEPTFQGMNFAFGDFGDSSSGGLHPHTDN